MRMIINTITTLILLLIFVSTVNGQTDKKLFKENIYGIIVGGTVSNLSNYDAENRVGFQAGLYLERKISEKFSTMPNIQYTERGAKGKDELPSIKLAYLSFPLMLKYNISDKFALATGVAWDILLSVKGDNLERDNFKDSDWRIPIVFGYNISDDISLGIGYHFGLTDITKNDNEALRNNWANISLAYVFGKKKD